MDSSSNLRRPTSGVYSLRTDRTDRQLSDGQSDKSSSTPNSSPRSSLTYSPTLPRSPISKINDTTSRPSTKTNAEPVQPCSRISSALSKFEKFDQNRIPSVTGLKPVPRFTQNNSALLNNSASNSVPGNRFLNGKQLNSVSSNKFGLANNRTNSNRVGGSGPATPSSLLQRQCGPGRFANKGSKKTDQTKDTPTRIIKKEEKDQLVKKLTPMQYRVTQEKVTERLVNLFKIIP